MNRTIIAKAFESLGWSLLGGTAIAGKMYLTAVGEKEAQAYVADYGPTSDVVLLTGTYWSEGRNCLEPYPVAIQKTSTESTIFGMVKLFVSQADERVAETYAAKLLNAISSPSV